MPPRGRVVLYIVAVLVAATVSFLRTPYSLILPGYAIDVSDVLSVEGHAPPADRFYLTDVTLQESVSPIFLLQAFAPGGRVVKTYDILPKGVSIAQFETIMHRAMDESQSIAAVVAERAANLPVAVPRSRVMIFRLEPGAPAAKILGPGDVLRSINGQPVRTTVQVQSALFRVKPGAFVSIGYEHRGMPRAARVATLDLKGKARLGIYSSADFDAPKLAVPVRFKPFNVSGSSGGLMFALDIYRSLRPPAATAARKIAGTGTIAYDGVVGPIEGSPQKLIAARRAGATVFLVPRENYPEVKSARDIRVIPVHTFDEALKALSG
ncbi:MAG: PDZ domain-containing protein [Candidatus Eremiobacteraeota bacterium]|nr:PDZ domain-containing protein [Candidatus Eremiobacteraeota bacterium]